MMRGHRHIIYFKRGYLGLKNPFSLEKEILRGFSNYLLLNCLRAIIALRQFNSKST